jgi:deoxycytidylate deaminase
VIGLVGAVGVDLDAVSVQLRSELADFGYMAPDLHLTDAFSAFTWLVPLVSEPFDERVWSYMTTGNTLREKWDRRDAMALLAINGIALKRTELTGDETKPSERTTYVLRSLKRPEEVALLRDVYGSRFLLIGVSSSETARTNYLWEKIRASRVPPHTRDPEHTPQELIDRDEREDHVPHGQDVRDTFHRADCFVEVGRELGAQLRRILDIFFEDPTRSPSRDEFGTFQAVAAARRSADLGRQVGAAVCTVDGDVVAVGVNEVPKPGGGLYWEGDPGDSRDVKRGADSNREQRDLIAEDIAARLKDKGLIPGEIESGHLLKTIEESSLGDIIEFVRAVHAEMAALIDAARRGVGVDGCTMYVTTFPCHHCARHIVAAGIQRVVYVAPYAKSRAEQLHSDAIVLGDAGEGVDIRIRFEPFVGVGPRRYLEWFDYPERKSPDGTLRTYDRLQAEARLNDRDPRELRSDRLPYLDREHRATALLRECEEKSGFEMKRAEPGPTGG